MSARNKEQRTQLILNGSLWKAMLMIAVPVMINSFLQTLYNLTDTYWLGQIGTEHLAAINLVSPVQGIIVSFGGGLTVAGSVLLSQFIGAGRPEQARKMASQIFVAAMSFSVLCVVAMEILTPFIVSWMGADGAVWQHAVTYLCVVMLDMPFLFGINLYQSVRQSQGDTVSPMLLNLLGIALNMALDPLLMVVWPLGAAGAALATLIAKAIPALAGLVLLCRAKEPLRLERANMKPDRGMLSQVVRIGLPTALGHSAFQLGFLLMSRSVFVYGVDAMAAYGIGNKSNTLNSLPANGMGAALATIVGQNMGAKQVKRAEKAYLLGTGSIAALLLLTGVIFSRRPVAVAVVSIFSSDPNVIAMAADFFSLMAMWTWNNAIFDCTSALFRGTGHTEITMLSDAGRIWVFRFATLFVCQRLLGLGVESIWYSVVVSNGLSALLLFILYLTGIWKKNRVKVS
ncbi:MAG: MATE family efflux transporter [Clostridia bacterium]|nr:MATE family efflux transporter [Clostridia bacterium]